jgi:hypothetical protein
MQGAAENEVGPQPEGAILTDLQRWRLVNAGLRAVPYVAEVSSPPPFII